MKKWVYVISAGEVPQKIGITNRLSRRVAELQTGHYLPLTLIFSIEAEDAEDIEQMAHKILSRRRMMGEWFSVSPADAIRAVKRAAEICRSVPRGHPYVGERVICRDDGLDRFDPLNGIGPQPRCGEIYTIARVHEDQYFDLAEVQNPDVKFPMSMFCQTPSDISPLDALLPSVFSNSEVAVT